MQRQHNKIQIMLVDDHPAFRVGMAALIETEPDLQVIAQTGSGRQAVELYRQHRPDVVLMDLRLPDLGGVEVTIALRKEFPDARVIVLTTFDLDEDIFRATQSGAQSYLLKDMPEDELIATIRAVHEGKVALSQRVAERLAARRRRPDLSQRELDVLQQLARGRTNKEIAAHLFISEDTVKSHIKGLFSKLNVKDRTDAVITAFRHGIVHP
ncbi:MAG TPA: response regulator transcription factor [Verrucomicrobiae bacterium]|nr:response regulator transcription factor [Verrucomicrobiae bacterium]